jgi:autoinducer 2-degrading protein
MSSVTLVHIRVKPECRDAFVAATQRNRAGSIAEAGNLRFDFLRSPEDPDLFFLYEAYVSTETAKAHKETPHYLAWRDAVAPMMAEPRRGQTLIALGLPDA